MLGFLCVFPPSPAISFPSCGPFSFPLNPKGRQPGLDFLAVTAVLPDPTGADPTTLTPHAPALLKIGLYPIKPA